MALLAAMAWGAVLAHPGYHHDIDRLTQAIAESPSQAELYLKRAELYRMAFEHESALADLDRAQALDPSLRRVAFERGMTLSALGRGKEAEAALTRFLESGPPDSVALRERGGLHAGEGRANAALADWGASLAIEPDPEVFLAKASLEGDQGLLDEAGRTLRDGVSRSGASTIRDALIDLEVRRGRFEDALALVAEDERRAPNKARPLLRKAEILERLRRAGEARAAREAALVEAERAMAVRATSLNLTTRAAALAALDRAGEARRDLELALQKTPGFAEAREALAVLEAHERERTEP
jgi:tetratricopeptide (TPR) repeat protein